jgi:hypothetical protein
MEGVRFLMRLLHLQKQYTKLAYLIEHVVNSGYGWLLIPALPTHSLCPKHLDIGLTEKK